MSKLFDRNWFTRLLFGLAVILLCTSATFAQDGDDDDDGGGGDDSGNDFLFNIVGGVLIDADGVLKSTTADLKKTAREELSKRVKGASSELDRKVELRMVSIKGIEAALQESVTDGKAIPEEVRFMGGLQRIQYVFLYPERNDIVLAGPGEGWMVSDEGTVVGETTGLPVIHLEDFLVALRHSRDAASGFGISCSIDPTQEGRVRFEQFMRRTRTFSPQAVEGIRQSLGAQQVTLTGIPKDSRFARVLVASDYQMKRLAMNLENSPLKELPSFLHIMKDKGMRPTNLMPRWWLATDYQPLGKSEDGLAWELRGQGVKCMTEDEIVTKTGEVEQTGRVNPVAQAWADNMNENYEALAAKMPIFGDLRNAMDLCVVAALIDKENMAEHVGLEAPMIFSKESQVKIGGWPTPKTIDTECSIMKSGRSWIITASGGVQVDSWSVAETTVTDAKVGEVRQQASANEPKGFAWN